jgi:hypothetical protein
MPLNGPWLLPYLELIAELGCDPWTTPFAQFRDRCNALAKERQSPVSFVKPKGARTSAFDYENRIVLAREVETRDTLHDAVNALAWLRFPIAKGSISALHAADFAGSSATTRTRRRDALTLFDEHGLALFASDPAWMAGIRSHRWQDLWLGERAAFVATTKTVVFGHGLLARLPMPHPSLTAHTLSLVVEDAQAVGQDELDAKLGAAICALREPRDLAPLPVMGLPAYSARQDATFYGDASVFRPLPKEGQAPLATARLT